FDLTRDSPIRIMLAVLGKQQHILLLTLHHIVSDRWSVGIFMQEVAAFYATFSNGLPSTLPELNIQYGDFSAWQREHVETIEKHLGYWQRKLNNAPPLLELPTDYFRPSVQRFRGNQYSFELPRALSAAIKMLAKQQNATLFMVMAAALNALFYRYTGSQDIVIGYTSAGRNQAETENLIGFFVNTLVLRSQFQGDLPFIKLLEQLREQSLEDLAYQDVSFGQLVEAVNPVRNSSHAPLFQVMLTVQNTPTTDFRLPELQVQPIDVKNRISQFDLTYLIEEKDNKLHGIIEYSTDLFDVATLERMSGHLETLLEGIVNNPNSPLNQLPLLTKNERRQLLIDWNPPSETQDSDCKPHQLIHQIFEAQAKTRGSIELHYP
ncbi:MAG: condensation domain-containing protein, partial [Novosphingobium sp.]